MLDFSKETFSGESFKWAIEQLKQGKKVRRPCWQQDSYWSLGVDETIMWNSNDAARIHLKQINAMDWELYEDKFKNLKEELEMVKRMSCSGIGCSECPLNTSGACLLNQIIGLAKKAEGRLL